jgi:uncharacterized radical SAM protein YgiQ
MTREECLARGWNELDFILISGDAYVDAPSFANAVIGRVLEAEGWRIGLICRPDWRRKEDFLRLGRPRLAALVSPGNLDSMLANYSTPGKRRSTDAYAPGGRPGGRPDRAAIVYANRLRECFRDLPVIIGGIEASLRRVAHYDWWSDSIRRSLLMDAKADLLVYGMGERPIREIARALDRGVPVREIRGIRGTCRRLLPEETPESLGAVSLPSHEETARSKESFLLAQQLLDGELDPVRGRPLVQDQGCGVLVVESPVPPLPQEELDRVYELPYNRRAHPLHEEEGAVPALEEVQFSVVAHRGCYGECSFCALAAHQGRIIQPRSDESILREVRSFRDHPDFKGIVPDVGGPTANFHVPACAKQLREGTCPHRACLYPEPCPALNRDTGAYLGLLEKIRSLPGIRRVFVRSGIRFDVLDDRFVEALCAHYVSGQLKIAPEHVGEETLRRMGKPGTKLFLRFAEAFDRANRKLGKEQYLVPYFMGSHPGCDLREAAELSEFLRSRGWRVRQVQDFAPTPMSRSTCMYWTGVDPRTGEGVHVPRDPAERRLQRALMQAWKPENASLVREALGRIARQEGISRVPRGRDAPGARKPGGGKIRRSP